MQPQSFKPTPDNSIDLEFRVERFDFNVYEIQNLDTGIKGILRVGVIPLRITKLREDVNGKPQFYFQSFNVISFINKAMYGKPDESPINPQELEDLEKMELEEGIDYSVLTEAPNLYVIINTKPYYKIRAKSTLTKVEVIKDRFDYFGNPMFSVQINTGISYSYTSR
jgi:hypothetical protein